MRSYLNLLQDVLDNGETHDDRTGVGTLSVFGRQWRHNMQEGFPLLTTKRVSLRWVFEELKWFLSGSTFEPELAARGVDIWKEWATEEQCAKFGRQPGELGPVYGRLWRGFPSDVGNVDQIQELMTDIDLNPNSRRLIVTGWHPHHHGSVALPPCHTMWQIKCHADMTMSLHLYARSIDIFLGLPFNIASYGLLLSMIARVTSYVPRDLVISFGDLHLYSNHVEQAREQLSREERPLPRLSVQPHIAMTPLRRLLNIQWEDITLTGYDPHPKIAADVAV
jgi:thymidylate synthase